MSEQAPLPTNQPLPVIDLINLASPMTDGSYNHPSTERAFAEGLNRGMDELQLALAVQASASLDHRAMASFLRHPLTRDLSEFTQRLFLYTAATMEIAHLEILRAYIRRSERDVTHNIETQLARAHDFRSKIGMPEEIEQK